jgi:tagatose 1,6-diphosphate aldolase
MKSLDALATSQGIIAALAIDQRKSLRRMIARAAAVPDSEISDSQIAEFKQSVFEILGAHASAVLIDPEYGAGVLSRRAAGAGLLLTYESDGFENPRPHRMLALMPTFSARRLRELGANGVKIFLSWSPEEDPAANDRKRVLIERIGDECAGAGLPFLLEPVVYDPAGADPRGPDFARRKPALVRETMQEFSKPVYQVDVLKVEFPVITAHLGTVYSREEALDAFRAVDEVARCPYIYLSAGVSLAEFTASLELASEARVRYSGVLCGRAAWQNGVAVYAREGRAALDRWLAGEGVGNLRCIFGHLKSASPWRAWENR